MYNENLCYNLYRPFSKYDRMLEGVSFTVESYVRSVPLFPGFVLSFELLGFLSDDDNLLICWTSLQIIAFLDTDLPFGKHCHLLSNVKNGFTEKKKKKNMACLTIFFSLTSLQKTCI